MSVDFELRLSTQIQREYLVEAEIQKRLTKLSQVLFPKHLKKVVLDLLLVNDPEMKTINLNRRNKDKTTDVLSFPLIDLALLIPEQDLGEIVISIDFLEKQALEVGHSNTEEFYRLLVHGILHCLGYDHETTETDAILMREKEEECLEIVFQEFKD